MGSLRGESKRGEGEPELWGQLTLGSQVGKERLVGASAGATAARGTAGAMRGAGCRGLRETERDLWVVH